LKDAEYVSNEQALRDILEWQGFEIIEGDFTRSDGSRTRIAVRTPAGNLQHGWRTPPARNDHEPDNPQGVWCCDTHRDEFYARRVEGRDDD
jgi:hypothetical protein